MFAQVTQREGEQTTLGIKAFPFDNFCPTFCQLVQ